VQVRDKAGSTVRDIRVLGPVLMIVFGLVLAFTPAASVGVTGSVGNAGNAGVHSKWPEDGGGQPPIEQPPPESPPTEHPPIAPPPEPQPVEPVVEQVDEVAGEEVAVPTESDDDPMLAEQVEAAPAEQASLPRTGSDRATWLVAFGALLLVAGVAILATGHRSASSR
jgi:LPXTG-motif cell wall-anchored protein